MRTFYNPLSFLAPKKIASPVVQPAAADAGAEQAAKDEASRKEREAASQRAGVRSTILTGKGDQEQFLALPKRRSTVLGGTA